MRLGLMLRGTACLLAVACLSANAQIFRAYVSAVGLDSNPCTLAQPCRLLPAALTVVADGGEVWMLDSANYNTGQVNVTKSVTLLAIPGVVGSVVATGGVHALQIGGTGIKVTLRNLVIVQLTSSQNGVYFTAGSELHVTGCEISGVQTGIYVSAPNSAVTVQDTVLRDTGTGFFATNTVTASFDGVHVTGNNTGITASDGSRVAVANSVISGNLYGIQVHTTSSDARAVVDTSVISGNVVGAVAQTAGAGAIAHLTVSRSDVSHNTSYGLQAIEAASATTVLVADANTVTHNGVGFILGSGPPVILSRGNNTLNYNAIDVSGGTLTPLAAQ